MHFDAGYDQARDAVVEAGRHQCRLPVRHGLPGVADYVPGGRGVGGGMMGAGLLAQYAVIAIAVLLSIVFVARKQFPAGVRRLRIYCAVPLLREGRSQWLQRVGRWLAP